MNNIGDVVVCLHPKKYTYTIEKITQKDGMGIILSNGACYSHDSEIPKPCYKRLNKLDKLERQIKKLRAQQRYIVQSFKS